MMRSAILCRKTGSVTLTNISTNSSPPTRTTQSAARVSLLKMSHFLQHMVTRSVAKDVVNRFELIQMHAGKRDFSHDQLIKILGHSPTAFKTELWNSIGSYSP